jgi:hypothetical protein
LAGLEFRFDDIRAQLRQPGDGGFRDINWLKESHAAPRDFFTELLRYHTARAGTPVKSTAEAGYDLYHDLVVRHSFATRLAFAFIDHEGALHTQSYAQLHARCTARCSAWAAQGVRPRQSLCIVAPMGLELLTALLCGLRMGLAVSLLPPLGADFMTRRLQALPDARIVAHASYLPLLGAHAEPTRLLASEPRPLATSVAEATSHTYEPDEPALALFSPLHEPSSEPVELTAAEAYLKALRDGLLLFQLQPGMGLAAPEHHFLQHQPALLLATLLQGAAFLHLSARALAQGGAAIEDLPLRVLLMNSAARDVMLSQHGRALNGLDLWLMNPQERPAPQAWRDFTQRFGIEAVSAAAFGYEAAVGGSFLFSMRCRGAPPELLQPAPGLPFSLLRPDDSGEASHTGYGVFEPLADSPGVLLSRRESAFVYAGPVQPARHGRSYPASEVEALVSSLPFVIGVSVYMAGGDSAAIALLVFTGPEPRDVAESLSARRELALREHIRVRLGDEAMPGTIELYAMFPRSRNGVLDHDWCQRQYAQSQLRDREAHPLYRVLDRLRAACTRPLWTDTAERMSKAGGTTS